MAEGLVFEIPKILMEKLISGAIKETFSFSQSKSQMKTLNETKPILAAWVQDADATQLTDRAQRVAFEQLMCALEKVHDSLEVREARAMRRKVISRSHPGKKLLLFFSPSSNPIVCALKEAREERALIKELERIIRGHSQWGSLLTLPYESRRSQQLAVSLQKGAFTSEKVIGRDKDRDKVIGMLLESSSDRRTFSVVSVVGMGGIGKTTLVQCVFSDEKVKKHFDIMIWVYVPQVLTVEDVMMNMAIFPTPEIPLQCGSPQLQYYLRNVISGKKVLLVLDNVWDHDHLSLHWGELSRQFIGFGGAGSMALTTTRSAKVANTMDSVEPYKLLDLTKEASWQLLQSIAFTQRRDQDLDLSLEAVGKEIAQMCPSVPLVIRSVGEQLKRMYTLREWMDFKDKLSRLSICGQAPSMTQILKLSYDQLDPKLRLCFIYSSLFPKGYQFDKSEFIRHCIALGYIDLPSESHSVMDVAEDCISCLIDQGFFEEYGVVDGFYLKRHDVIHDLAVWIAGSKYKMASSWSPVDEFDYERIRHLSLGGGQRCSFKDWPYSLVSKTKNQLQSFLVHAGAFVGAPKLDLPNFECLRVLSIPSGGLTEVPRTISKLFTLRYLRLSGNGFKKLPDSITQLVNLVFLDLSYCKELQELPRDLGKLENLLELNLRWCTQLQKLPRDLKGLTNLLSLDLDFCDNLTELPRDMSKQVKLRSLRLMKCEKLRHMPVGLGNCTRLQRLDLFVAKGRNSSRTNPDNSNESGANQVGGFAELRPLNNLRYLKIVVDGSWSSESEAGAANLEGKEKLKSLKIEFVGGSSRDNEMMLQGFQPNPNLGWLEIRGYKGDRIPTWIQDIAYLSKLNSLRLENWDANVSCLGSSLGRLPVLETLAVAGFPNLEYVVSSDMDRNAPSTAPLFPSLEVLVLQRMPKLKGCQRMSTSRSSGSNQDFLCDTRAGVFPRLTELTLKEVGLEVVPDEFLGLPSLKFLRIEDCQQLKETAEWIGTLAFLQRFHIRNCLDLTSSPEQLRKLRNFGFQTDRLTYHGQIV